MPLPFFTPAMAHLLVCTHGHGSGWVFEDIQ